MKTNQTCWAVIPAAGIGTRMGAEIPKQYLPLMGKTVLEHTVLRFCEHVDIRAVIVVLADNDLHWKKLSLAKNPKVHTTTGGIQRYHSVFNGLRYLEKMASVDDWVLVHDAARPCIRIEDINKLIQAAVSSVDGAVLAIPERDTMKRATRDRKIESTVSRDDLWHAQTPQIFRYSMLKSALENVFAKNIPVTDESQAIEMFGKFPMLVEGHADNIKITHPADLMLAEVYLKQQESRL